MTSSDVSTWNRLGLGVAAAYASLGAMSFLRPAFVSEQFGLRSTDGDSHADAADLLALVGARDFGFFLALVALSRGKRYREMGIVILSTMPLCIVDLIIFWRNGRRAQYVPRLDC